MMSAPSLNPPVRQNKRIVDIAESIVSMADILQA
jgi:hypothetical protein